MDGTSDDDGVDDDGIAFVFCTRAAPDEPIVTADGLFTTLATIGVTRSECRLIFARLATAANVIDGDELAAESAASEPLQPGARDRALELKLRALLVAHSSGRDEVPTRRRRRSSKLVDYAARAEQSDDRLRNRLAEALDAVLDGVNELELEIKSHERPARSCYTILLTLACLRPVLRGVMTRDALAMEWRISALEAAPSSVRTVGELSTLTPRVAERNRKGRTDFRFRLAISLLATCVADVMTVVFDSNWAGGLLVLSSLDVAVYTPAEKGCVEASRDGYAKGVVALRSASLVATVPAFLALIYVSTFTFQSDKGFASFLRVIRYLRDRRSRRLTPGDCARPCWFNQATNVIVLSLYLIYIAALVVTIIAVAIFYLPQGVNNAYRDVNEDEFSALVQHAANTSTPLFVGSVLDGPPGSIGVRKGWASHLYTWRIVGLVALLLAIVATFLRTTQTFASLLAVLQITRGVGAKLDRTAVRMVAYLQHTVARLHSEKGDLVDKQEIQMMIAELEELEVESRLERLGMASQRWQAFISVTLWTNIAQVFFAFCYAGLSFLPIDDCYDAEADSDSVLYDVLTRMLLPPVAMSFVVTLYSVTIPHARYAALANRVKVEGERTMRSVEDWNERFGPNLEGLLDTLTSDRIVALHSFKVCGLSVDKRLFARVITAATAAFVLSGFAINNARSLGMLS